jgi:hypothetical protein
MGARLRKLVLLTHVVASVGWIGAVAAYLALVIAALTSDSAETVQGAFIAMELVYFALVPLAATALITGLTQSLGSSWGLFRHYWVVIKLVLTVVAITVMLLNLSGVSSHADHVTHSPGADMRSEAVHQLQHAGVGLLMLLVAASLGLYKPRGMTRYGRRATARPAAGPPGQPAAARGPQ